MTAQSFAGRRLALLAAVGLIGGMVTGPGRAYSAPPLAPAHASAATAHPSARAADPEATAVAQARWSGRPVEVASEASATTAVYAQPNGTLRATITALPSRVQRGGRWVSIDTTLRHDADGTLAPTAVNRPLALSTGGSGQPLVRLGSGGQRLELWWPSGLPAPRIAGATATYAKVRPGVDVRVTATEDGFRMVLVVGDRSAGQRLLSAPPYLRVVAAGLTVHPAGNGGLAAVNPDGAIVFAAPSARMWDATAGRDPGHADRTAPVRLGLADGQLTLSLDRAMVTSAATRYPLQVDPSFSGTMANWTDALAQSPDVSFWNGQNLSNPTDPDGPIMVGKDPVFLTAARALFQMHTSNIIGKHILGATFRITEGWANSCTASEVELWLTGGISSSTTWNHQPTWMTKQAAVTTAHRSGDSACNAAQISFNATNAATSAAANGWTITTLGLRAGNETDVNTWKRFQKDASLQIDYNSIPTVGTMSTNPPTTCVSGGAAPAANDPVIISTTPQLRAVVGDADTSETQLKGNFVWQRWNGSAWAALGSGNDPTGRSPNTQTSVTVPLGQLADGGTYRWQVRIADPLQSPYSGTDYSAWSQWCEFSADFSPPPGPAVTSTTYTSGCDSCGGVGVPATFTLSSGNTGDVNQYLYGFTDPPSLTLTPATTGGDVTFTWAPPSGGPYTLYVESKDVGGHISPETRYSFTVATPAPIAAQWLLGEIGGTTLADTTGNGHAATLASGTLGGPSRIVGQTALTLNGDTDHASADHVLDTSGSYTVTAWTKISSAAGQQAVVSQDGTHVASFTLKYDGPDCGCWNFTLANTDADDPANTTAWSGAAKVGVWTQVTGVYDAVTGKASIYVNGALAGTSPGTLTTPWNSTGVLQIGRSLWDDGYGSYFAGSLSTVEVWPRALAPLEVQALYDPTIAAQVASNGFEDQGGPGTIEVDGAPTGLGNHLMLEGTANVPPSGAGHNGLGLALDGGGYADSALTGPVLHTDQSFTVSAWVRLGNPGDTTLPTVTETAVSQVGQWTSGFFLGFRYTGSTPKWALLLPGMDGNTGAAVNTVFSSTNVTTADLGRWHQLSGVFDAATGKISLYVDGGLQGSFTWANGNPWDATGPLTVGAAQWSPTGGQPRYTDFWTGAIDDLRVYQGVVAVPVANWGPTVCSGTPGACPDAGSGNHPLTLAGGASVANVTLPSLVTGSALSFDGSTGVATTSAPVLRTDQSFTVGAWVRMDTLPTSGTHVVVSQSGLHKSFFELQYDGVKQQMCLAMFNQDATNAPMTEACGPNLVAGQWMFVTGVYDAVAGTVSLYTAVPGGTPTLAATAAFTSPWYVATGTNAWVRVGAGYNGTAANTAYLSGYVTDVRFYSGAVADLTTLM